MFSLCYSRNSFVATRGPILDRSKVLTRWGRVLYDGVEIFGDPTFHTLLPPANVRLNSKCQKKHWCCLAGFRANTMQETTMIRCGIERPSIYLKLLASFFRSDLSFRSTSVVSVFIRFLDFHVYILIDLDGRASGELQESHYVYS